MSQEMEFKNIVAQYSKVKPEEMSDVDEISRGSGIYVPGFYVFPG